MVNRWFGVGQFLSGAMGQLYPGGDKKGILLKTAVIIDSCLGSIPLYNEREEPIFESYYLPDGFFIFYASDKGDKLQNKLIKECNSEAQKALKEYKKSLSSENTKC
jgi:hypothetical protein